MVSIVSCCCDGEEVNCGATTANSTPLRRKYSISLPVVRLTPLTGPRDSVVRRIRLPLRMLGKSSEGGMNGGMLVDTDTVQPVLY